VQVSYTCTPLTHEYADTRNSGKLKSFGNVKVNGSALCEDKVKIFGKLKVNGTLEVQGAIEVWGALTINGYLYVSSAHGTLHLD
jgi:hypothetical protein